MKVSGIETFVTYGAPRNWVFVKVSTDVGFHGWGEATLEWRDRTMQAAVAELGAQLVGEDPLPVEYHWQRLYRHGFWKGGVVLNSALAALDQALWDIRGKAWGVPVYRLLGGPARERIRVYTHVGIYDPQKMIDDARRDVAAGFTALKTGSWLVEPPMSEPAMIAAFAERVALLREAVGPNVDILFDNHGRSLPGTAVRMMRALEPYRLFWLEELTQPDDIDALARLRAANPSTDLATGERLYSKWDFLPLLEKRLVDVIQPDICHAGGITEVKKIAALAEAYYVQVAPHNPQGPISTAAAAHLGMAIPNFSILELVQGRAIARQDGFLKEPWEVRDGYLQVPDRPGLGVDIDEEAFARHPAGTIDIPSAAFNRDGGVADI